MTKKIPPSILRNYKPETIRLMWYVKALDEFGNITFHSGFTIGGIRDLMTRKRKHLTELKMIDLKRNRVYKVDLERLEEFLKDWSVEYQNPKWTPKSQSWVVHDKT